MTQSTYFVQPCPICGRGLHIRVEYLGRELNCPHCRGKLQASDPDAAEAPENQTLALLQRADELLDQSQIA